MRPFKMVIFILPLSTAFFSSSLSVWVSFGALIMNVEFFTLKNERSCFRFQTPSFCFKCCERPWMTWLILFRSDLTLVSVYFWEIWEKKEKKMFSLLFHIFGLFYLQQKAPKPITTNTSPGNVFLKWNFNPFCAVSWQKRESLSFISISFITIDLQINAKH